jgi:hypothetical protein
MVITQEFLRAEIADLQQEIEKAKTFLIQADGAISAYKTLIAKLIEPEPEKQDAPNPTDNP